MIKEFSATQTRHGIKYKGEVPASLVIEAKNFEQKRKALFGPTNEPTSSEEKFEPPLKPGDKELLKTALLNALEAGRAFYDEINQTAKEPFVGQLEESTFQRAISAIKAEKNDSPSIVKAIDMLINEASDAAKKRRRKRIDSAYDQRKSKLPLEFIAIFLQGKEPFTDGHGNGIVQFFEDEMDNITKIAQTLKQLFKA